MTAAPSQFAALDDVLTYRHPGVVARYCKDHRAERPVAEEVFRETLKWLYLCRAGADAGLDCAMTPDVEKLDWMWHTFVLFTRDYADFCEAYLGEFIHHHPEVEGDETFADPADLRAHLERQYGLVYDLLGEETLRAWYDECRYAATA